MSLSKGRIKSLLGVSDYEGLIRLSTDFRPVIRHLISMTYDRGDVLCHRAIKAIGILCAGMPAGDARAVIQRLLWMMRDESGGNPWSAPDIIGEIISRNPGPFEDIVPVLVSFHDEEIFTGGVIRSIAEIAAVRGDLASPFEGLLNIYLRHQDPYVRGHAVIALERLGKEVSLKNDEAFFDYFDGEDIVKKKVRA